MKSALKYFLMLSLSIIAFFALSVCSSALDASGQCGENVTYTFDSSTGTLTIIGSGNMTDSDSPFQGCSDIKKIIIKNGVTSIGRYAFYDCQEVKSIVIPNSITKIGENSFSWCKSIENLSIPKSVTTVEKNSFCYCSSMKKLTIESETTDLGLRCFDCSGLEDVVFGERESNDYDWFVENGPVLGFLGTKWLYDRIEMPIWNIYSFGSSYLRPINDEKLLQRCVDLIAASLDCDDLSVDSQIKAVYDWVISNCKYVFDSSAASAFDLLFDAGSCTAYGELVGRLLDVFGIENQTVTGTVDGIYGKVRHLWNLVHFSNGWYHLDASDTRKGDYSTYKMSSYSMSYYVWNGSELEKRGYVFNEENYPHEFKRTVIPPTPSSYGYARYTCANCSKKYLSYEGLSMPPEISAPQMPSVKSAEELSLNISWSRVTGSTHYNIYRYDASTNDFRFIACVAATDSTEQHYTDTGLDPKTEYAYKIEAVYKNESKSLVSEKSAPLSAKTTGHSFDDGLITTNPTCKDNGKKTYTCIYCSATKTETIAKNASNHTGGTEVKNAEAATCTATGYTGDTYCKGCGAKTKAGTTIAKKAHTQVAIPAKAATCTVTGLTEGYKCSVCGTIIKAQTTVAKKSHVWNSGVVTTTATCKSTGVKTYTCSVCSATKTETIAKNPSNHTGGTEVKNAKAATCTATGYTGDTYCKGCGAKTKSGTTIAKKAHTQVSIPAKAATCTTTGLTEGSKCSVCGTITKAQTTVKAFGHDYKAVVTAPTCTEKGLTTYTCSRCEDTYTGNETAAKGHTYDSGKVTKASTYTATGVKTYTCTVCKATKTETIAKLKAPTVGKVSGLKASKVKANAIKLAWSKATNADKYEVYRSTDGKKWTKLTTTTKLAYTDKAVKAGTKYQYKVRGIHSESKATGAYSSVLKTQTLTAAPKISSLKSTKAKTATVKWSKVTGAKSYIVYTSKDGKKFKKAATTAKTTVTLSKLTAGKKVYVKIIAVNAYGKNSAYSAVKSVKVK